MIPPSLPSELEASGTTCKGSLDTPFLLSHVCREISYEIFSIKPFIDIITQYLNVFQQHFTVWITSVICCLFSLPFRTWGMEMNAVTFCVPEGILKKNKQVFKGNLKKNKHILPCIYVCRDDRLKAACFVWKNHVSGLQWSQPWGTSVHYLTEPHNVFSAQTSCTPSSRCFHCPL